MEQNNRINKVTRTTLKSTLAEEGDTGGRTVTQAMFFEATLAAAPPATETAYLARMGRTVTQMLSNTLNVK